MGVAGDDQLGADRERAGEHGVVVGVALDRRGDVGRDDFARVSLTAINEPPMIGVYEPVSGGQTGNFWGLRKG